MAQKVSEKEIKRLENQKVQKNEFVDGIDAIDRGLGGIPSAIGKFLAENF